MTRHGWLLVLLLVCSSAFAGDIAPIRLAGGPDPSGALTKKTSRLIDIVFKKINMPYSLEYLPPERSSALFISGEIDGIIGRVAEYNLIYPAAIRIEPTLYSYQFIAVGLKTDIDPQSWDDLKKFRIAYHRGLKIVSLKLAQSASLQEVNSIKDCILMAKNKHVDFCVAYSNEISFEKKLFDDGKLNIFNISKEKAYIFLSPKLSALAVKIDAVLADMKKSGELEKIYNEN